MKSRHHKHHHLGQQSFRYCILIKNADADADGPFELTTVGSILELDECPGDESADDIPMNAADE